MAAGPPLSALGGEVAVAGVSRDQPDVAFGGVDLLRVGGMKGGTAALAGYNVSCANAGCRRLPRWRRSYHNDHHVLRVSQTDSRRKHGIAAGEPDRLPWRARQARCLSRSPISHTGLFAQPASKLRE